MLLFHTLSQASPTVPSTTRPVLFNGGCEEYNVRILYNNNYQSIAARSVNPDSSIVATISLSICRVKGKNDSQYDINLNTLEGVDEGAWWRAQSAEAASGGGAPTIACY